jgi:hypothetical protein
MGILLLEITNGIQCFCQKALIFTESNYKSKQIFNTSSTLLFITDKHYKFLYTDILCFWHIDLGICHLKFLVLIPSQQQINILGSKRCLIKKEEYIFISPSVKLFGGEIRVAEMRQA